MGVVSPHIGLVSILCRLMEIVILLYQLLQLEGEKYMIKNEVKSDETQCRW